MDRFRLLSVSITLTVVVTATSLGPIFLEAKQNGSIQTGQEMLKPRSGHTATLLADGRVLIAGGMRRNQDFYRSAELFDPTTRKFRLTGDMNERRVGHVAVRLRSGKVLIAGGWVGPGCTDSAELYDPTTEKFSTLASRMTTPRGDARATLLDNGNVLITGGADHNMPGGITSAEIFNVNTMRFRPIAPMHFARVSHTATLLQDGRVLVAGGRGERLQAVAEIFDPRTNEFTETGSVISPRYKHTAGLLPDGRVLIAGGSDERDWNGNLRSAEVYEPNDGKFKSLSPLNDSRFKLPQEAVQLSTGEILIAGGSRQVEIFEPSDARFHILSGQMPDARHFMTETKLRDGSVLLAGGYANDDNATAQTWFYQP